MNDPTKCEFCESENIKITKKHSVAQAPYGPSVSFEDDDYQCLNCESGVDYTRAIESSDKVAMEASIKASTEMMLNDLKEMGYSSAYVERALHLPQRTLSRWRFTNELSSVSTALLRVVRTYPFVLKVAEKKFDSSVAINVLAHEGLKVILSFASEGGYENIPPSVIGNKNGTFSFWVNYSSPSNTFLPNHAAPEMTVSSLK